jgi:hypothetical protein
MRENISEGSGDVWHPESANAGCWRVNVTQAQRQYDENREKH